MNPKYFIKKEKRQDLNIYFNKFYKYRVTFEDNSIYTYSDISYYALRRFLANYVGKQVEDVEELNEVEFVIDYRKTKKEAFDYICKIYGDTSVLNYSHNFNPLESSIFPKFKILN